jgi:hypothetical protein
MREEKPDVVLERIKPEDAQALYDIVVRNADAMYPFINWVKKFSCEDDFAENFVARYAAEWDCERPERFYYTIWYKGKIAGAYAFKEVD